MTTKALIPVRSGSKRVEHKNIKSFAHSNLLEIKINQMKRIKALDGIIVNSNDDEMLRIAKKLGAEAVKREEYFAGDNVTNEMCRNVAQNCDSDVIVYVNVTNPLIKDETIELAIQSYYQNLDKFDSLNTVNLVKDFLWLDGKAINYNHPKMPKSQDLPNILAMNFALNIISRDKMIERSIYVGERPNLYVIDKLEATDIDDTADFEFAEFMYKKLYGIQ